MRPSQPGVGADGGKGAPVTGPGAVSKMAHVKGISVAHSPRGKWKRSGSVAKNRPQQGKENEPSAWDVSGTQSGSKICVLAKSRLPSDLQQAWDSPFQGKAAAKKPCAQISSFNLTEGDKDHAVPCADMAAAPELPTRSPDPLARSQPRGSLEEIQLGAAAGKSVPPGKEVSTMEFVADPVALTTILSNVGLASNTLGAARKPCLARRVPLMGRRGNSVHSDRSRRTLHGSQYVALGNPALHPDPARSSCFSRLAAKDADRRTTQDPAQQCGLLQSPQIQALSATLRDSGACAQPAGHPTLQSWGTGVNQACQEHPPPIATAVRCEAARSQDAGGTGTQFTDGRLRSPSDSRATGGQSSANSDLATRRDPVGASQTEEFVQDLDALASILSNVGLSHTALGAMGKISLVQRAPVKELRGVPPSIDGSTMGSRTSLLRPKVSGPPKHEFSRTSCRSVLGLKGLEASDALRTAQEPGTPWTKTSSRDSPYGLARRVPVTQPQSLRGTSSLSHHKAVFTRMSCPREPLDKHPLWRAVRTPARWVAGLSPQSRSSDPDELALPCEKIAVNLFGDTESPEASARKAHARHTVPRGSSNAERIEILARLLQQEVEWAGGSLSLEELHKFLAACVPALYPSPPGPSSTTHPLPAAGAGLERLPSPSSCCNHGLVSAPPASSAGFPATDTTLTFSSQQPVCAIPLISSLRSPPASRSAGLGLPPTPSCLALVKQQREDLLDACKRFHVACLRDEVAFYRSWVLSRQLCPTLP